MKITIFSILLTIGVLCIIGFISMGNNQGSLSEETALAEDVSFREDVFPIIEKKCNTGECHGPKGKAYPKYTTHIMIEAKSKKMMKRIQDEKKPMPPEDSGITLKKEELAVLQAWIDAGMPNN